MNKDKDLYYLKRYRKVLEDEMGWTDSDRRDEIENLKEYIKCRKKKDIDSSTTSTSKKGK